MNSSKVYWADVVFSRLRTEERIYVNSVTTDSDVWTATMTQTLSRSMKLEDCVMALVYECEINNRELVDVIEEALVSRREHYKRISK